LNVFNELPVAAKTGIIKRLRNISKVGTKLNTETLNFAPSIPIGLSGSAVTDRRVLATDGRPVVEQEIRRKIVLERSN
jgi:hypothetical protein